MAAFKDLFNPDFFRALAEEIGRAWPPFAADDFTRAVTDGIDALELKARISRTAECCHRFLPDDFRAAVEILKRTAAGLKKGKTGLYTLFMPEYVARYGLEDFDFSMDALQFFTPFGTSEFAVREFILTYPERTLARMRAWSDHANEQVRRLASEGSRPRLPWGVRLPMIVAEPTLTLPILENLKADPSIYVRKSIANHLNDIGKDHPDWMLDTVERWGDADPGTAWIIKHACRDLIKKGNARALALFGGEGSDGVRVGDLRIVPATVPIGAEMTFTFSVAHDGDTERTLIIDYAVRYARPSGKSNRKVFKLKTVRLPPGSAQQLARKQHFRDVSIRTHHPGTHVLEIQVNGSVLAREMFELVRED